MGTAGSVQTPLQPFKEREISFREVLTQGRGGATELKEKSRQESRQEPLPWQEGPARSHGHWEKLDQEPEETQPLPGKLPVAQ